MRQKSVKIASKMRQKWRGTPLGENTFWTIPILGFLQKPVLDLFRIFPILSGMAFCFFPICPFPLSRPAMSTYKDHSRKGPGHHQHLS